MKEYDEVNIRHLKFTSGDEVISYVANKDMTDPVVKLERPLQVHRYGLGNFFFSKWHPFAGKDECVVNPVNVVSHSECNAKVKERYIQLCLKMAEEPEDLELTDELPTEEEIEAADNVVKFPDPKTFH